MYIQVYKKDGKWIRNDNKHSLGQQIPESDFLETLKVIFGNHIFARDSNNQNISVIYRGYINNGKLISFCEDRSCKSCLKKFFCKQKRICGYYIFSE